MRLILLTFLVVLVGCAARPSQHEVVDAYRAGLASGMQLAEEWIDTDCPCKAYATRVADRDGRWRLMLVYVGTEGEIRSATVCRLFESHCGSYASAQQCQDASSPLSVTHKQFGDWVLAHGQHTDWMVGCSQKEEK